jgi:hypothetical protein
VTEAEFEKSLSVPEREAFHKIEMIYDGFRSKEGGRIAAGIEILDMLGEILKPLTATEQVDLFINYGLGRLKQTWDTLRGETRKGLPEEILAGNYAATMAFSETCVRGGMAGVLLFNLIEKERPGFLEQVMPDVPPALRELEGKIQELLSHS